MREKRAAKIILRYVKAYLAKKKLANLQQGYEERGDVKQSSAAVKIEASESGLSESVYLKLTLRCNYAENHITLTLSEVIGIRRVICKYILPTYFTGPLKAQDAADEQLSVLKDKCAQIIKKNAPHILLNSEITAEMFTQTKYEASKSPHPVVMGGKAGTEVVSVQLDTKAIKNQIAASIQAEKEKKAQLIIWSFVKRYLTRKRAEEASERKYVCGNVLVASKTGKLRTCAYILRADYDDGYITLTVTDSRKLPTPTCLINNEPLPDNFTGGM